MEIVNKNSVFNMMIGKWNGRFRKFLLRLQQLFKVNQWRILICLKFHISTRE